MKWKIGAWMMLSVLLLVPSLSAITVKWNEVNWSNAEKVSLGTPITLMSPVWAIRMIWTKPTVSSATYTCSLSVLLENGESENRGDLSGTGLGSIFSTDFKIPSTTTLKQSPALLEWRCNGETLQLWYRATETANGAQLGQLLTLPADYDSIQSITIMTEDMAVFSAPQVISVPLPEPTVLAWLAVGAAVIVFRRPRS